MTKKWDFNKALADYIVSSNGLFIVLFLGGEIPTGKITLFVFGLVLFCAICAYAVDLYKLVSVIRKMDREEI